MAIAYSALTGTTGNTVFGNMRVAMGLLTLDSSTTSGTTACGLKYLVNAIAIPATACSFAATISSGTLSIISAPSGTAFYVTAFGR